MCIVRQHITQHAKDRLDERGISSATLNAVVLSGDDGETVDGKKSIHLCGTTVVVGVSTGNIITAFTNDRKKYPLSPKRRAREQKRKRQCKKTKNEEEKE